MSDDEVPTARETERIRKLFAGPCEFVAGAANIDAIPPPNLPEMAFVGRSNVGKSSLINALTGRGSLARTSNIPGATKQINFFRLGNACNLVDLPGYGYARISKEAAEQWRGLIFDYLRGRPTLRRVLLLIDSRRGAMEADHEAMKQLDQAAVSYVARPDQDRQAIRPPSAPKRCSNAWPRSRAMSRRTRTFCPHPRTTGEGLDMLKAHIAALARP